MGILSRISIIFLVGLAVFAGFKMDPRPDNETQKALVNILVMSFSGAAAWHFLKSQWATIAIMIIFLAVAIAAQGLAVA